MYTIQLVDSVSVETQTEEGMPEQDENVIPRPSDIDHGFLVQPATPTTPRRSARIQQRGFSSDNFSSPCKCLNHSSMDTKYYNYIR